MELSQILTLILAAAMLSALACSTFWPLQFEVARDACNDGLFPDYSHFPRNQRLLIADSAVLSH